MKNEVHHAASRLLEILYTQDIDQSALEALILPHKADAIKLLIKNGLAFEDEVYLQTNERYCYYSITTEGEKQFESGGFVPERKISVITYTLIMAVVAIAVGFALFHIFCS